LQGPPGPAGATGATGATGIGVQGPAGPPGGGRLPFSITPLVAFGGARGTSIAIGSDGLPLIAYDDPNARDLRVAHCSDPACTTATTALLDSVGAVGASASIAIGADGLGLISYLDLTEVVEPEGGIYIDGRLKVAHCSNVACTSATVATLDAIGDGGGSTSIAIGVDGLGLIAYSIPGAVRVAHCANTLCSTSTNSGIDGTFFAGEASIAIGADGLGLISYNRTAARSELKVAHCSNTPCTSFTLTPLDSSLDDDIGAFSSITIGDDGLGLISYHHTTQGFLKVAHCSNAACSMASFTPHVAAGTGSHTAITVGPDGLGLIAYRNGFFGNGELKVAHCSNLNCSQLSSVVVDSDGDAGVRSSITIGPDGFALISYRDQQSGALRVAHCSNAACLPNVRRR
jgi:hypothetical protein